MSVKKATGLFLQAYSRLFGGIYVFYNIRQYVECVGASSPSRPCGISGSIGGGGVALANEDEEHGAKSAKSYFACDAVQKTTLREGKSESWTPKTLMASEIKTPEDVRSFARCAREFLLAKGFNEAAQAFRAEGAADEDGNIETQWRSTSNRIYVFLDKNAADGKQATSVIYPPDTSEEGAAWGNDRGLDNYFTTTYRIAESFGEGFIYYNWNEQGDNSNSPKTSYILKMQGGESDQEPKIDQTNFLPLYPTTLSTNLSKLFNDNDNKSELVTNLYKKFVKDLPEIKTDTINGYILGVGFYPKSIPQNCLEGDRVNAQNVAQKAQNMSSYQSEMAAKQALKEFVQCAAIKYEIEGPAASRNNFQKAQWKQDSVYLYSVDVQNKMFLDDTNFNAGGQRLDWVAVPVEGRDDRKIIEPAAEAGESFVYYNTPAGAKKLGYLKRVFVQGRVQLIGAGFELPSENFRLGNIDCNNKDEASDGGVWALRGRKIKATGVETRDDLEAFVQHARCMVEHQGIGKIGVIREKLRSERWFDNERKLYVFVEDQVADGDQATVHAYPIDPIHEGTIWGPFIDALKNSYYPEVFRILQNFGAGWTYYTSNPTSPTKTNNIDEGEATPNIKATFVSSFEEGGNQYTIGSGLYDRAAPRACRGQDNQVTAQTIKDKLQEIAQGPAEQENTTTSSGMEALALKSEWIATSKIVYTKEGLDRYAEYSQIIDKNVDPSQPGYADKVQLFHSAKKVQMNVEAIKLALVNNALEKSNEELTGDKDAYITSLNSRIRYVNDRDVNEAILSAIDEKQRENYKRTNELNDKIGQIAKAIDELDYNELGKNEYEAELKRLSAVLDDLNKELSAEKRKPISSYEIAFDVLSKHLEGLRPEDEQNKWRDENLVLVKRLRSKPISDDESLYWNNESGVTESEDNKAKAREAARKKCREEARKEVNDGGEDVTYEYKDGKLIEPDISLLFSCTIVDGPRFELNNKDSDSKKGKYKYQIETKSYARVPQYELQAQVSITNSKVSPFKKDATAELKDFVTCAAIDVTEGISSFSADLPARIRAAGNKLNDVGNDSMVTVFGGYFDEASTAVGRQALQQVKAYGEAFSYDKNQSSFIKRIRHNGRDAFVGARIDK